MWIRLVLACAFTTTSVHGQSTQLEDLLRHVAERNDIPAMAILVLDGERIIEMAAAGVRVRGGEDQVTIEDAWHLGSCTKAMTATLAARLVEQGMLRWDSTIAEVLPDMADGMDRVYRDVTLKDLLLHRGGVAGTLLGTEAWKRIPNHEGSISEQRSLFIEDVLRMSPAGPVGEFAYSNGGYTIAGHMCSVAAGVPFEELLKIEVFEPLGMTSAGYGVPLARRPHHPNGHGEDGTPSPPGADNPAVITPAGRVHCTMQDWGRFVGAHLVGKQGGHDLLQSSSFNDLHLPAEESDRSYAMGWGVVNRKWAGGRTLTHAGSNTMWFCVAWVAPMKNMAVLVACNQGGEAAQKACDEAAHTAIALQQKRLKDPRERWSWDTTPDRTWIGAEFWANRLQDWRVHDGRVECVERRPKMSQRTCHLLPWRVDCPNDKTSTVTRGYVRVGDGVRLSVRTGAMDVQGTPNPEAWSGFLLGAGGDHVDHRLTAQVHHLPAEDGGLLCLVDETGRVSLRHNDQPLATQSSWAIARHVNGHQLPEVSSAVHREQADALKHPFAGTLEVVVELTGYKTCTVTARSLRGANEILDEVVARKIDRSLVDGNIALVSHLGAEGGQGGHWFDDLDIQGDRLTFDSSRSWGPVLMTQYTISDGVLNLTAQLPPLGSAEEHVGTLEIMEDGGRNWLEVAQATMHPDSRTLHFRVEGRDPELEARYRVRVGDADPYEGVLRAEPDDGELVLGAMNCQKVFTGDLKWNHAGIWMPHAETVESVGWHDPDMLFFAGDQIYEGDLVPVDNRSTDIAILDYLYKWYRFCWSFEGLTRNRPTVTIPDDHDVYHGNIWGAGGRKARKTKTLSAQDSGGYKMPALFVNAVHATQTSHLPEPYDPAPIEQGISVYFTNLDWGGGSFAILDDRMFKSSPSVAVPAGQFVNGWPQAEGFQGADADVKDAELLGDRQEVFLEQWATDWAPQTRAKIVLSQTLFSTLNTLPPGGTSGSATARGAFPDPDNLPTDWTLAMDADTNGWPQTPRDTALRLMRRGFAFHVCGDQHLGSTVQYGVDAHRDAAWAFCLPAVANTWPRRWYPPEPGLNRAEGAASYTGDFLDGFGNRVSVAAVANPARSGREPTNLHDRMPGYGIIRIDLEDGDVIFECWPRWEDPARDGAEQYPGWPVEFALTENMGTPTGYLAKVPPQAAHVRVFDSSTGEMAFVRALWRSESRLPVYGEGPYDVEFMDSEGKMIVRRTGLKPMR